MMDGRIFGKNVEILRRRRGLSVSELAEMTGVPEHIITRNEAGTVKRPSSDYGPRLAEFFGADYGTMCSRSFENMYKEIGPCAGMPAVESARRLLAAAEEYCSGTDAMTERLESGRLLPGESPEGLMERIRKRKKVMDGLARLLEMAGGKAADIGDDDERTDFYEKLGGTARCYGEYIRMTASHPELKENEWFLLYDAAVRERLDEFADAAKRAEKAL